MRVITKELLRTRRVASVLLLGAALAACDTESLLDVPDREVANPQSLQGEQALPILLAGAKADFQYAYSGGAALEGQVNIVGLLTDELYYTSTFPTRIQIDRREIQEVNSTLEPIHRFLHRARAQAQTSANAHKEFKPNTTGHAESLNLYAYTLILFAENYCSGVPLSTLSPTGAVEYGDPQTTQQLLQAAVAAFDEALTVATAAGSSVQQNLAGVGKGRALLNLGRAAEAATAVAGVPTTFVYNVFHSENSDRQNNAAYVFQYTGRRWSVGDREGVNGIPFRSAADPRVPWARGTGSAANAFDDSPLYLQFKYDARTTSTVLASGVEARLIEAEAALAAGGTTYVNTLNALRAAPPAYYPAAKFTGIGAMQPLTDPGTAGGRIDLLFRERAMWMYLTSHRLGDMRRLVRQYNRTANSVFPTGTWGAWAADKSGEYGTDVNFPIPFDEKNNPKFTGCLDRNA